MISEGGKVTGLPLPQFPQGDDIRAGRTRLAFLRGSLGYYILSATDFNFFAASS